jgi:hypothetical protein
MKVYKTYNTGLSAPFFDVVKDKANDLLKGIKAPEVKTSVSVDNTSLDAIKTVSLILGGSAIAVAAILALKKK